MLGTKWVYPDCESEREEAGLGLLPMEIQWNFNTPTSRSQAKPLAAWGGPDPVEGYEIHSARPRKSAGVSPLFELSDGRFDGAVSKTEKCGEPDFTAFLTILPLPCIGSAIST